MLECGLCLFLWESTCLLISLRYSFILETFLKISNHQGVLCMFWLTPVTCAIMESTGEEFPLRWNDREYFSPSFEPFSAWQDVWAFDDHLYWYSFIRVYIESEPQKKPAWGTTCWKGPPSYGPDTKFYQVKNELHLAGQFRHWPDRKGLVH